MSVAAAEIVWTVLGVYAGLGALAALVLFAGGLARFDPLAAAAPWRVKLILAPGIIALWPLMLAKTLAARKAP